MWTLSCPRSRTTRKKFFRLPVHISKGSRSSDRHILNLIKRYTMIPGCRYYLDAFLRRRDFDVSVQFLQTLSKTTTITSSTTTILFVFQLKGLINFLHSDLEKYFADAKLQILNTAAARSHPPLKLNQARAPSSHGSMCDNRTYNNKFNQAKFSPDINQLLTYQSSVQNQNLRPIVHDGNIVASHTRLKSWSYDRHCIVPFITTFSPHH